MTWNKEFRAATARYVNFNVYHNKVFKFYCAALFYLQSWRKYLAKIRKSGKTGQD